MDDNYTGAEVGPAGGAGDESKQMHEDAVAAWDREGVLWAEDKHVFAAEEKML